MTISRGRFDSGRLGELGTRDGGRQTLVNLVRNNQPTLGGDERIFHNSVGTMVRSEFTQRYIPLRQETFLDPSMAETMEGEQLGVETHFRQPETVPRIEFVVEDWSQGALVGSSLKQRRVGADIFHSDNVFKGVDGADGAQPGALVVSGQRDLLNALAVLNRLSFEQLEEDSLSALELNVLDIPPAQEADRVDVFVRLRDERRRPKHRQVIDQCEDFVYVESLCVDWAKRGLYCGVEEVEQDLWSDREAAVGGSLGHVTEALDDPAEGAELGRRRTVHSEIRVILFNSRNVVFEASCRLDPAADHQVGGVQSQVPTSDR